MRSYFTDAKIHDKKYDMVRLTSFYTAAYVV